MSSETKDSSGEIVEDSLKRFRSEDFLEPWLKDIVMFSCRSYQKAHRAQGSLTEQQLKDEIILGVHKAFRRLVVLIDIQKNPPDRNIRGS